MANMVYLDRIAAIQKLVQDRTGLQDFGNRTEAGGVTCEGVKQPCGCYVYTVGLHFHPQPMSDTDDNLRRGLEFLLMAMGVSEDEIDQMWIPPGERKREPVMPPLEE